MAFNPFNVFRRNQRILFAILTIIIMFMFVLSSGLGGKADFFDWLPGVLARKAQFGDVMAVVDGRKVTTSDLGKLQVNRVLANEYMANAALIATNKLAEYVRSRTDQVSPDHRPTIQELVSTRPFYLSERILGAVMSGQLPAELVQQLQQSSMAQLRSRLTSMATATDAKADDLSVARAGLQLMDLDQRRAVFESGQYFINQPNQTDADRMDFFLWLKKADRLGVHFTDSVIQSLIRSEFNNQLTAEDWLQVEKNLGRKEGYSPESLRQALGDEFRVRMAQTAVLGPDYARSPNVSPGYSAPYDLFRFYQDQLSPARFGVISLPAENFLSEVTGEPSESELVDLFKKYARAEPNPASPTPGFREPRRLKVAWLEVTGTEPYYQNAAKAILPSSGPMPEGVLAVASGLAAPTESLLQTAYRQYRETAARSIEDEWFTKTASPFSQIHLYDGALIKPHVLAALSGAMAGSLLTGGSWFSPALTMEQTAIMLDLQGRAQALVSLLPPPLTLPETLGSFAVLAARIPEPLPLAVVQSELITKLQQELAYQIAHDDVQTFQRDLSKLGEKLTRPGADSTAAREFAEKFIRERGLKSGATTDFHDQYSIADDPNLTPLKMKAAGPHGGSVDSIQFGRRFFFEPRPGSRREEPTRGLFQPRPYPTPFLSGPSRFESVVLVWRTAEIEDNIPKSLEAKGVRDKVVAAWRLEKAKQLARKAAEQLAQSAEKLGDNPTTIGQKLLDLHQETLNRFADPQAKARVKYFEIDDVAPLVAQPLPSAGRMSVAPFTITRTSNIPYPSPAMSEKLLATRKQPLSTPVVLADAPESTYYVAVLLSRSERSPEEFGFQVYNAPSVFGSEIATAIQQRYHLEFWEQARKQAIELLKIEFRYRDENPKLRERAGDR